MNVSTELDLNGRALLDGSSLRAAARSWTRGDSRRVALSSLLTVSLGAGADVGLTPAQEHNTEFVKHRGLLASPIGHQGVRDKPWRRARDQGFAQTGGLIAALNRTGGRQHGVAQHHPTGFDLAEPRDAQEAQAAERRMGEMSDPLLLLDEGHRVRWLRLPHGQWVEAPAAAPPADGLPAPQNPGKN